MSLWTPPGADLGEFDPPQPDPIMVNFSGGFDQDGHPRPMTYRRLKEVADTLTITSTTPEGPASLLGVARNMFALSFYCYQMLAASAANSIVAVESALKVRLASNARFNVLIDKAVEEGLVAPDTADVVHAGRQIRNNYFHEGKLPQWTFAMAHNGIGASYRLVRELYPENEGQEAT